MLRRRRDDHRPVWTDRLDRARATIVEHADGSGLADRLEPLGVALSLAEADRGRIGRAVAELDPDGVTLALRDALEAKAARTGAATDADERVDELRGRYEAVQSLQRRDREIEIRIDATVTDLERLATRTVELSRDPRGADTALDEELRRLETHLAALDAAHADLHDL